MKVIDWTPILKKYKGKWIILDDSRTKVMAAAPKLDTAIARFQKKYGDKEIPSTFKVPTRLLPFVG